MFLIRHIHVSYLTYFLNDIFCSTKYYTKQHIFFNNIYMFLNNMCMFLNNICMSYNIIGHMYVVHRLTTYMWSLCNIFLHLSAAITPFVTRIVQWAYQFIVSSKHFNCTISTLFFQRDDVFYPTSCFVQLLVTMISIWNSQTLTAGAFFHSLARGIFSQMERWRRRIQGEINWWERIGISLYPRHNFLKYYRTRLTVVAYYKLATLRFVAYYKRFSLVTGSRLLCIYMYIYIFICVYIYIYTYIYIYINIYVYIWKYTYIYIYEYIYIWIYIYICVCIYVYIFIYIHIYLYIKIYIYI